MVDEKYFAKEIAKTLGINLKDLTINHIHKLINRLERKAVSCTSDTKRELGHLVIYDFMSYKEELKLRQYIKNWHK